MLHRGTTSGSLYGQGSGKGGRGCRGPSKGRPDTPLRSRSPCLPCLRLRLRPRCLRCRWATGSTQPVHDGRASVVCYRVCPCRSRSITVWHLGYPFVIALLDHNGDGR